MLIGLLVLRLLGTVLRSLLVLRLLIRLLVLRLGAILRSLGLLRLLGNVRIFHCKRYLVLIIC